MNHMATMMTLGCAALLCLGLTACGGGNGGEGGDDGGGGDDAVLLVTANPLKATYALGEQVEFDVVLKNVSASDIAVATVDAALKITALTRDGAAVPGTTSILKSESELLPAIVQSLVTLTPGGETTIHLVTNHTGVPDGQVLAMESMGATDLEVREYSLGAAGAYSISISYRFQGANPGGLPVFIEESDAATAAFTVAP